jgi:anti-sigma regulatory factor (Ser/Thr protein kinase)
VPAETAQVVVLLVSELATNSVRHASSAFHIEIDHHADHVRVQLSDTGDGEPTLQSPTNDRPSGRGLLIVDNLADEWGVELRDVGKAVWFVVRLAPDLSPKERRPEKTTRESLRPSRSPATGPQGPQARLRAA